MPLIVVLALIIIQFVSSTVVAQPLISNTITKERGNKASGLGREFWFAIPQNSDHIDKSQKYFQIYITSPKTTQVNLQISGGSIVRKPVTAGQVTIFTSPVPKSPGGDISLSSEIATSGVVENKAVHIWSEDADIAVYFLSRMPFTSDGMLVLPTVGWGKNYVVGAFASLVVSQVDYPSEFVVIADQDSTILSITPNWDLRKNGFPNTIEHPKGIPFSQRLNRGECVQYQVTAAQTEEWDVSGTLVSSNKSIGVIGASVCPFIPSYDPYCDYVVDMLQPKRVWSNSYVTAPFAGRRYGGDAFLMVATKDNQLIFRNGEQTSVLNKYKPYFAYDIDSVSLWTSDAPFMLIQYVCSAAHGVPSGKPRNLGDPAMVVINPADQFVNDVIFQTPTIDLLSGQNTFTNYVNILLPSGHEPNTFYDGERLNSLSLTSVKTIERFPIAGSGWEAIRLTYSQGKGEGTHRIISDTGVGVYIYGYGVDDSYAWSGNLGVSNSHDIDTMPPIVIPSGSGFLVRMVVKDDPLNSSQLSEVSIDSSFNMKFTRDAMFIAGAGTDSTSYSLRVVDSTREAYALVSVYDFAGNRTRVISKNQNLLSISCSPEIIDFGIAGLGSPAYRYLSITNRGTQPFSFPTVTLELGDSHFAIDSIDNTNIKVGEVRLIRIRFITTDKSLSQDAIIINSQLFHYRVPVKGMGGVPDFSVVDYDYGCIEIGTSITDNANAVFNLTNIPLTIDSVWVDDTAHFSFAGTPTLPAIIAGNQGMPFMFKFRTAKLDTFKTVVHFRSKEVGIRTGNLRGCGAIPIAVRPDGYATTLSYGSADYLAISSKLDMGDQLVLLPPVPNPAGAGASGIRFVYGLHRDGPIDLSIYDLLGNHVATVLNNPMHPMGIYETEFVLRSDISPGNYFYRLAASGSVISGKLIIAR